MPHHHLHQLECPNTPSLREAAISSRHCQVSAASLPVVPVQQASSSVPPNPLEIWQALVSNSCMQPRSPQTIPLQINTVAALLEELPAKGLNYPQPQELRIRQQWQPASSSYGCLGDYVWRTCQNLLEPSGGIPGREGSDHDLGWSYAWTCGKGCTQLQHAGP